MLIQNYWHFIRRGDLGHTHTQREGDIRRHREKTAIYIPRREGWHRNQHLILDLWPQELWDSKFWLFRSPSLWYLVSSCRKLMKEVKPKMYIGIGL